LFLLLFGGGGGCIFCEFAELIVITAAAAACLQDCSCEEFSSDAITGWGCGEGEEGIVVG